MTNNCSSTDVGANLASALNSAGGVVPQPQLPPCIADFLDVVFQGEDQEGIHILSVPGDPNRSRNWYGGRLGAGYKLNPDHNLFYCVGILKPTEPGRSLSTLVRHVMLVFDDVGTKVPREKIEALRALGYEPTAVVETSPGNYQYVFKLAVPVDEDGSESCQVLAFLREFLKTEGWGDPACFDPVRYMRLPGGINGKEKYRDRTGEPWHVKLIELNKNAKVDHYALARDLVGPDFKQKATSGAYLTGAQLAAATGPRQASMDDAWIKLAAEVGLQPQPSSRAGVIDLLCPNGHNHASGDQSGFASINPGMFYCNHGSCQGLTSMDHRRMISDMYDAKIQQHEALGFEWQGPRTAETYVARAEFERLGALSAGDADADRRQVEQQVGDIVERLQAQDLTRDHHLAQLEERFIMVRQTEGFFDKRTHELISPKMLDMDPDVVKIFPLGGKAKDRASNALLNRGRMQTAMAVTKKPGAPLLVDAENELGVQMPMLNLWKPSPITPNTAGPDPVEWLDHGKLLYPDPVDHNYMFDCWAYALQHPDLPMPIISALIGRPGTGKDVLLSPLKHIVGLHNVRELSADELMSQYTEWKTRRLIYMGEFTTEGHRGIHERLRDLTSMTPSWTTINPKFGRQYSVKTALWFLLTSNDTDALRGLQAEDRRFHFLYSEAERLHGPGHGTGPMTDSYFERIVPLFSEPQYLARIYGWLMRRNLSAFDPNCAPPRTNSRQLIAVDSLAAPARAIYDELTGGRFAGRQLVSSTEVQRYVENSRNNAVNRPQARHLRDGFTLAGCKLLGQIRTGTHTRERVWSGAHVDAVRLEGLKALDGPQLRTAFEHDQNMADLAVDPSGTRGPVLVADNTKTNLQFQSR